MASVFAFVASARSAATLSFSISVQGQSVLVERWGTGPTALVFFSHSGDLAADLKQNEQIFPALLGEQYSLFLWKYPDAGPFSNVQNAINKWLTARFIGDPPFTLADRVHFPGVASSVVSQIRTQPANQDIQDFCLVGNSLGAGVILSDYEALSADPKVRFVLVSPSELFLPASLPDLLARTVMAADASQDFYLARGEDITFVQSHCNAPLPPGNTAPGHLIIGQNAPLDYVFRLIEQGAYYYEETDNGATIRLTGVVSKPVGPLVIPATINGKPVTSIGNRVFSGCTGLTTATIPPGVISIGDYAFDNCTELASVNVPDSVTSIGTGAFRNCARLSGMVIPSGITSIADATFAVTGLSSVTIPQGVKTIGWWAFGECTKLTSVTIPATVTSIGDAAFEGCNGLASAVIPSGVVTIGAHAFGACEALASVTIAGSVTGIGENAFAFSYKLSSAEFLGDAPTMGTGVFDTSASSFTVFYHSGKSGFASPTWSGYPAVNIDTASPYATWQASKFTAPDIATGLTTLTADFDHDGVANFLEYAFGTNPKAADAPGIAANAAGGKLQISFPCDATCTDITYTVQSSTTLAPNSWTDIAKSVGGAAAVPVNSLSTVSDSGTGARTVTVTDSIAVPAAGGRFLRVEVTSP